MQFLSWLLVKTLLKGGLIFKKGDLLRRKYRFELWTVLQLGLQTKLCACVEEKDATVLIFTN